MNRRRSDPVVVVGSGPTGAIAATMLASHGVSTIVLEAGDLHRGGIANVAGRVVARVDRSERVQPEFTNAGDPETAWHAHLALGGLSNYWTCAVPRYSSGDFLDGRALGETFAWPVGYDDLLQYYAFAERRLGVWGASADHPQLPQGNYERLVASPAKWQALQPHFGQRPLARLPLARGRHRLVERKTTQFNSYADILKVEAPSLPLEIRRNARVERLNFDARAGRVVSVSYRDATSGANVELPVRAVVLAAGAIITPTLLLRSTSSAFPEGLGNRSGLVGRFLHDHTHHMFVVTLAKSLPRLGHPLILGRRGYHERPLSGSQCTIGGRVDRLDRALSVVPVVPATRFGMVAFGTAIPREADHVTIDRSGLDTGRPVICHGPVDDMSRAVVADLETDVVRGFESAGLGPDVAWRSETYAPGTAVHYAGTVRMHANPGLGPADCWSRLHDVANVAIADASVFTYSTEKNPTLTAMALAARAADRLAREVLDD